MEDDSPEASIVEVDKSFSVSQPMPSTSSQSETSTSSASQSVPSTSSSVIYVPLSRRFKSKRSFPVSSYFHKSISAKKRDDIHKLLVSAIVKNYLAFQIVESKEFKTLLSALNPAYELPSRKTVSKTIDSWTSISNESYVSVTAHFIDSDITFKCYLWDCLNYSESHSADKLATLLRSVAEECKIGNKIEAVVTDNAANVVFKARRHYTLELDLFYRILETKDALLSTIAIHYPNVDTLTSDDIVTLQKCYEVLNVFLKISQKKLAAKHK
ncbi:unnamed protein product [Brassicogethes aeneus]|uniref:DUF659 domain-containing protein n=1 Tax=Brassicogethes aeneus TaxID=1431903 RepID=A0A9P0BEK0_BRAAE|nr:unnamed protein product [Brassicogethes aeneus]